MPGTKVGSFGCSSSSSSRPWWWCRRDTRRVVRIEPRAVENDGRTLLTRRAADDGAAATGVARGSSCRPVPDVMPSMDRWPLRASCAAADENGVGVPGVLPLSRPRNELPSLSGRGGSASRSGGGDDAMMAVVVSVVDADKVMEWGVGVMWWM